MGHMNNRDHAGVLDAIENLVVADRKPSIAFADVIAAATGFRVVTEELKSLRKAVDQTIGGGFIVLSDVLPDGDQVALRAQSADRASAALPPAARLQFQLAGEGCRVDMLREAADSKIGFSFVKRSKQRRALKLALFPQFKRGAYRLFLVLVATAFDGASYQRLLSGCGMQIHASKLRRPGTTVKSERATGDVPAVRRTDEGPALIGPALARRV